MLIKPPLPAKSNNFRNLPEEYGTEWNMMISGILVDLGYSSVKHDGKTG
jgi:hypothetical protein